MKKLTVLLLSTILVSCQRGPSAGVPLNCPNTGNYKQQSLPVRLQVNNSVPSTYYACIESAIATWNGFNPNLFVMAQGSATQLDWYAVRPANMVQNMEAITAIQFAGPSILSADIEVNAQDFNIAPDVASNGSIDCESLLIHELGHSLGLVHTTDYNSVMYPALALGQTRRTLQPTEEAAIQCLYQN